MASQALLDAMQLARMLTLDERLQLIAYLANAGRDGDAGLTADGRPKWADLLGTAPHPALGEDAQAWVSRTRAESDDDRERRWRQSP